MTNILYVIWSLGLGGAEQVVISLAKGLDKSRFMPFIACLNDEGRFAEELKKDGIQVFSLDKVRGLDFSVVPKLVKIIKENDIQIVHTHLWGANFWGRFAANAAKVPVVVTEHNVDVWKTPFHFLIDRWLFRRTDRFVAVSDTVRSFYARKLHVPKEKIQVVYNGIDKKSPVTSHQSPEKTLREEFGIKEDEKVISIIGRLVPQKGVSFFLDALKIMFEDRKEKIEVRKIKVLIVGEGPLLESHKSQVTSHKLEHKVKFLGFRKDIPEILSITDVLVLPSSREGLPMIVLEAMAAGVIVIATRVGGTPELVEDGVNGFLVEYGDVEGLKNTLMKVLKTEDACLPARQGGQRTEGIKANAKKTVEEKFSLKKMVGEHEEIYNELLNTGGRI